MIEAIGVGMALEAAGAPGTSYFGRNGQQCQARCLPPEIKLSRFSDALILDLSLVTTYVFRRAVLSLEAHNDPYPLSSIFYQTCMGWFWADAAAPARPVAPHPISRSDATPPVCCPSKYML